LEASSDLALEKGRYASYSGSKWSRGILPQDTIALLEKQRGEKLQLSKGRALIVQERLDWKSLRQKISRQGMRNSNVLALAPTATISTIAGVYPSFEPLYKNLYVKANMTGEFTVLNPYLLKELKVRGLWNQTLRDRLKAQEGRIEALTEIPLDLRRIHKEVFDIDPELLLDFTALRSVWIDQSQSHTIFYKGTSGKEISRIYQRAWKAGLKTSYYLRCLGASTIEKSTLDAKVYGFTQKRSNLGAEPISLENPSLCKLEDPSCESCQ